MLCQVPWSKIIYLNSKNNQLFTQFISLLKINVILFTVKDKKWVLTAISVVVFVDAIYQNSYTWNLTLKLSFMRNSKGCAVLTLPLVIFSIGAMLKCHTIFVRYCLSFYICSLNCAWIYSTVHNHSFSKI